MHIIKFDTVLFFHPILATMGSCGKNVQDIAAILLRQCAKKCASHYELSTGVTLNDVSTSLVVCLAHARVESDPSFALCERYRCSAIAVWSCAASPSLYCALCALCSWSGCEYRRATP